MKRLIKIPCPVCFSRKYKVLFRSTLSDKDFSPTALVNEFKNSLVDYTKHGQIVKCNNCELVYVNPVENISSYLKAYKDVVDDEYLQTEKFRKILSLKHLNNLTEYSKKGTLLDVGCFAGYFLELAKKRGWAAHGIEPSAWASKHAVSRGIKILGRDIIKTKLKRNFYDAVTLWDVIEHLSEPVKTIQTVRKSLKPGGLIAIGTPDVESFLFKVLKDKHPYFIRMHLVLFSPKTLGSLLEKNGFKIIKVYKYGRTYSIDYFLKRLQTRIVIIKYLRVILSNKFFHDYPITLNLRDEFTIIARKSE